jgi:hypothetical protein
MQQQETAAPKYVQRWSIYQKQLFSAKFSPVDFH